MHCFVTGASGFIGANLVHELVRQGHRVRALIRPASDVRALDRVDYERVSGDVAQRQLLIEAMAGCDWCFHAAASYHLWLPDYRSMYETNVQGTQTVLEAAHLAGCSRIVYTSTVGCVGLPYSGGIILPTDETAPIAAHQLSNDYKKSKWEAEQISLKLAAQGLPVIIVNPTAPVGPRDVKPTPTGQIIVDFLNRKIPAYLDTGLNWVHVRDVVAGHILAAEKGRVGERYILGNREGNWSMRQTLKVLSQLSGEPAPKIRIPYGVALLAAYLDEWRSRRTGKPPRAPLAGVKMARYKMFFNPSKAIRDLGLPQTPPIEAFREAIHWFRENGYVTTRPETGRI